MRDADQGEAEADHPGRRFPAQDEGDRAQGQQGEEGEPEAHGKERMYGESRHGVDGELKESEALDLEAMDHPGIVHKVTRFFGERGANIRDLNTETLRAAHTGAPVFNLEMSIELPLGEADDALREAFARFCAAEGLDGVISGPTDRDD